ncbi:MAG: hypothetical protein O9325_00105 [Roseomonas sp.]|nr:hypothetical protein [Roseomonas sp.]
MTMLVDIASASLFLFAGLMLAVQFLALWAGTRIGARRARRIDAGDADTVEGIGVVVGGLLGLLAFTLSISIGLADKRYDDRRRASLDEANAIGTAWLRAHAVGHPRGVEVARLLEGYLADRVAWIKADRNSPEVAARMEATGRAQTLIWGHAAAIAQERTDPVMVSLLASLNEVFDRTTEQRWAFRTQTPPELPVLLLGLTIVSVGAIGYQWGLRRRWHPVVGALLLVAWSGCLTMIVDLANPRLGAARVDIAPYEWTRQGFAGGVPIPPAPR